MTSRKSSVDPSSPERAARSGWQRAHLFVRVFLIMCIVTAPALIARVDDVRWARLTRDAVGSPGQALPPAAVYVGHHALLANYLAQRSPLLDELLPAGAGGTVFVRSLPEVRGLAFSRHNSILISLEDGAVHTLQTIEMHERAHLAHAQLSELVQAILTSLAPPAPETYAATNSREHFAEMASEAWELLQPAGDICPAETPREQLARVEAEVPGSAGFIVYFLRHSALAAHPHAAELRAAATAYIAPAREQWERLYLALEARRQADGTLTAWPVPSMREWVDRHRAALRAEGGVLGHAHALAFWPSAMLLRLMGA